MKLITPVNGFAEMPKDADPLTVEQQNVIANWINDGARWPDDFELRPAAIEDFQWWSYQSIKRPDVPKTNDRWVKTPVDAFILKRMRQRGLTPSEPADRRTLIRRLTFDLTGLPPSNEEVVAFVADQSPDAFDRLVDRLLESKHYGERWARHWLDVVKYGDTCGYDKDKLRLNAWPYRDYVIRSFNDDKPYSRFVQEQIAGDVMFPGEADGILGMGFIAAGPWDFIGHVEVSESKIDGKIARNLDRDDMVSSTMNTFCSLTVQCARCHNHKFDPIKQKHYYALQNVFAALDRADRAYDLDPKIEQKRLRLSAERLAAEEALRNVENEISSAGGEALESLNTQIAALRVKHKAVKPKAYGYHSVIETTDDVAKWVQVDLGAPKEVAEIVLNPCHDDYAKIGAGFGFPVRFKVEISVDEIDWESVSDHTKSDVVRPKDQPFHLRMSTRECRYVRVTATKLAPRSADYIFAIAELQVFDTNGRNIALGSTVDALDSIQAPVRWSRMNLVDGKWPRLSDSQIAGDLARAIRQREKLLKEIETPDRVRRRDEAKEMLDTTKVALRKLPAGKMVYAAATDFQPQGNFKPTRGKVREIRLLNRGDVRQAGEVAKTGTIPLRGNDWLFDSSAVESTRRAQLASWLTDKNHPLVWRSIVNRIWQYHFGQGIVSTPNDFGRMGATPTHPELLDWLATEFRDGRQSFKDLHRLIVRSSVYQQQSIENKASAAVDGGNQFLWRMNRRRLSAEEIRDSILATSGALNRDMGGPGYFLFSLEQTTHSPHYEYHKFDPSDPNSHRRSIYRFIVRSQPDPWMTTLDCADSSQSTPSRNETLTPLQALTLMNSKFNLAMASRFAQSLQAEEDADSRIDVAVRRLLQRDPTERERLVFQEFAADHGLPSLCRFMFNLSEFVFID